MEALQTSDNKDEHNKAMDRHEMKVMEVTLEMMILQDRTKTHHLDLENDRNESTNKDYGYEKVRQCKMQRTITSIHRIWYST